MTTTPLSNDALPTLREGTLCENTLRDDSVSADIQAMNQDVLDELNLELQKESGSEASGIDETSSAEAMNRRNFLRNTALGAAALALAPSLTPLTARAQAASQINGSRFYDPGYGDLAAAGPELALPPGFQYVVLSEMGRLMTDGSKTPRAFDGMAAFGVGRNRVRLIRNHEDRDSARRAIPIGDASRAYDTKAGAGTTSLDVVIPRDGAPYLERDFVSLNGTVVNCAGGPTPWGSWISCEETTEGETQGRLKDHGYCFEVPVDANDEVNPIPLKAMGRFVHEAIAVDPRTGIVYLTEDRGTSGFYRFIPNRRGQMQAGGRLQMLTVFRQPNYNTITGQQPFRYLGTTWVDIDDADPAAAETDPLAVFKQGWNKGGAVFSRLEGCWWGDNSVYFHATDGGDAELGQVWRFTPLGRDYGVLTLIFESRSEEELDAPDNITISPRGGIIICEDGGGEQHLRGLTRNGQIFDFAQNIANDSEFAGACFSPDGRVLFVNIQGDTSSTGPGIVGKTFAIWGPWWKGAL